MVHPTIFLNIQLKHRREALITELYQAGCSMFIINKEPTFEYMKIMTAGYCRGMNWDVALSSEDVSLRCRKINIL